MSATTAHRPALVRAELVKFATVRIGWILILAAVAETAVNVGANVLLANFPGLPGLSTSADVRRVFAGASGGLPLALVLGILTMTAEYRHQTITSTLLATPRRMRVVLAKTLGALVTGLVIGLACVVATVVTALATLPFMDHAPVPWSGVVSTLLGALVAYVCYAVLGTAIGTLITSQVAAITLTLLWVMLVEPLLTQFFPRIGRWLPGGAASGLTQTRGIRTVEYLAPVASAALLLAYTAVLVAVASRTTLRRDIT